MKKKLLIIPLFVLFMLVSSLVFTTNSVQAADITVNISSLTDSHLTTILNDLKTRKPNWFSDYKYFLFSGASNSPRYILIVPNGVSAKFILWSETVDADEDLDAVLFTAYCTSAMPCLKYQYSTAGVYQAVVTYSTNIIESNYSTLPLHYTNIYQSVKRWWWDGSEFIPIDFNMDDYQGGIPELPSTVTDSLGFTTSVVTGGDRLIIDELKYTGNIFQDGFIFLGNVFIGLINGLIDVISNLFDWLVDTLFVPSNPDAWANFTSMGNTYMNRIPCWGEVNGFLDNLSASGTKFAPVTATLFGKTISFDIKSNVFDPFLPVANNVKTVFKFVIWFSFSMYLWKVGQTLINGGNPPSR